MIGGHKDRGDPAVAADLNNFVGDRFVSNAESMALAFRGRVRWCQYGWTNMNTARPVLRGNVPGSQRDCRKRSWLRRLGRREIRQSWLEGPVQPGRERCGVRGGTQPRY